MTDQWLTVAAVDEVPEGGTLAVEAGGEAICLYKLAGRIYATQELCTHDEASLADGCIEDDCIECPLHQARFHIPSGAVRAPPAMEDLRVYPVKIQDGDIRVQVSQG
jgi:nitrite reductase/ring-hydroxylating ferredoxin subunit